MGPNRAYSGRQRGPEAAVGCCTCAPAARATIPRDGLVWVLFGPCEVVAWIAVDGGAPAAAVLPLVRPL
jgi:hypothetical protein